jgi:hypothetical protein
MVQQLVVAPVTINKANYTAKKKQWSHVDKDREQLTPVQKVSVN